jgi:aerobic-type carbon monoxide dehydrogenase small subunit (CoxS/CutS family)
MSMLRMTLNGRPVEVDVPESRYLSEVLRGELGLKGTKIGCNEAECGICTVLVNGTPVSSCVFPAFKAQDAVVETIESLSADGTLHPLQQAFLDQGAVQCGICTPGMIMTAKALIDDKGSALTEDEIKTALKDTYCRCTGYRSIVRAILQAARGEVCAKAKAGGSPIGRPMPNPNARAKIDGSARFTDDYEFPGMLYARTKRAGVPHARILSIDTTVARELPGVRFSRTPMFRDTTDTAWSSTTGPYCATTRFVTQAMRLRLLRPNPRRLLPPRSISLTWSTRNCPSSATRCRRRSPRRRLCMRAVATGIFSSTYVSIKATSKPVSPVPT